MVCVHATYGAPIENVSSFRYLGFTFHAWLSPLHGAVQLAEAGQRACHALLDLCRRLRITSIPLRLRLFDTLVAPVLLYACEIWLPYLSLDWLQHPMERIHRFFLRSLVRLAPSTPTHVVYWDFGRNPLARQAFRRLCSFHSRLAEVQPDDAARFVLNEHLDYSLTIASSSSLPLSV